jgi:hypothetical protein
MKQTDEGTVFVWNNIFVVEASNRDVGLCRIKCDGLFEIPNSYAVIKVGIIFLQIFILCLWARNKLHIAAIGNVDSVKVKCFHREVWSFWLMASAFLISIALDVWNKPDILGN